VAVCAAGALILLLFCGSGWATQTKKTGGGNFDQIAKQAAEASEQNRLEEAAKLYRQALGMRPQWAEGWWSLGTLEYDRDNYAEAARAFRKLIALAPKNGTARVMLGLSEFELGQDEAALKHIQEGDALGVMNNTQLRQVALYHEGVLLLRAGKYGAAAKPLKALCEAGVQNKDLVQSVGLAVFGLKPSAAPPEGSPGQQVVFRAGQAECLEAQKQTDSARNEYQSLVAEYPEYPNLHYVYGRFLLELHETDGAVEQFKAELKRNPQHLNAMLEIAAVRYRSDSADGVKYARQAVALAPKVPFAHYLLGLLLVDTGEAAEALPELEIARKAYPNEPSVYFALGTAYARTGKRAEAAQARATFLRLNALKAKQPGETVYGEQPSGLAEDKLQQQRKKSQPQ
jgi:tetratricopeptide (TPR) repeat protein